MNLEEQVCSLELSKRLKELGVKQKSLFYYQNNPYQDGTDCIDLMIKERRSKNNENVIINTQCENDNESFSAFTASEVINLLPECIPHHGDLMICNYMNEGKRVFCVEYIGSDLDHFDDENICNMAAKMLVYLLENGLISNA